MTAAPHDGAQHHDARNAIAFEQAILDAFGNRRGSGRRGRHAIGIISAPGSYEFLPLWHTLLAELGYSIVMPDIDRCTLFDGEATTTIPSANACTPAKDTHKRVFEVIDQGADAILCPSFIANAQCAVLCSYSQVLINNIPALTSGKVALISPLLDNIKLWQYYDQPRKFAPVLAALQEFDQRCAPGEQEFYDALKQAISAQRSHEARLVSFHRQLIEILFHDSELSAALVVARPYHLQREQIKGIDRKLAERGYIVISPRAVKMSLRQGTAIPQEDPTTSHGSLIEWMASSIIDEPAFHTVFLLNAKCGYDAIHVAEALRILTKGNRRSGVICLDESEDAIDQQIEALDRDFSGERNRRQLQESETVSPADAVALLVNSYEEEGWRRNAEQRFSDLPNSFCVTVAVLFRDSLNSLEQNPDLDVIHLPAVCKGCLVDSLSGLLSHRLDRDITVLWDEDWDLTSKALKSAHPYLTTLPVAVATEEDAQNPDHSRSDAPRPVIGLVGNPLLCFNDSVVAKLTALIEKCGGQVLLPNTAHFIQDGADYTKQLDAYSRHGVDGVLCLQDSNCLKEHINVRGSLQPLRQRYPFMHLVSIEYDNDLSTIVLENRVNLVVARALENMQAEDGDTSPIL